jgi:5-methyltetrahydrofolate--homocysteine methyltransferase
VKVGFADLQHSNGPVVLDGAMGSMLLAMGKSPAQGPHHACLEDPETVSAIHSGYTTAGARAATTNTFLVARENEPFASGILSKGMELARTHGPVWLSIGPAGPAPRAVPSWWPLTAGADAILFETWSGPDLEPWLAFRPLVPLIVSFCLQPGGVNSLGGWSPSRMADFAHRHEAMAVGINCGWDGLAAGYPRAVGALRKATSLPIVARPASCGLGPEAWAGLALRCVDAGATHIGGCCGTTPEHIRFLSAELNGRPRALERGPQGRS